MDVMIWKAYLVHMKIFYQINASLGTRRWESFLAFTVIAMAASVILQNIYCLTIKKIGLDKVKSQ